MTCNYYKSFGLIWKFEGLKISELIHNSASENEISDYVYKNNKKIYQNGLQVVANGDTSLSELMRVIED